MTQAAWLLTLLAAACTAVANLSLRAGVLRAGGFSLSTGKAVVVQPLFLFGVFCYGLAALIWFRVLSISQVTASYPVLVSLTFLLVSLGAYWFFQEQLTFSKIAGMSVIIAGIVIVARS